MNPALDRLFSACPAPAYREALTLALKDKFLLRAEALPEELLTAVFILAAVARDFNEPRLVDDYAELRRRTEAESPEGLAAELLAGASFTARVPNFTSSQTMNCGPGEVHLEALPVGARFRSSVGTWSRGGVLVDKTASRAVVEWEGMARTSSFVSKKTGEAVEFESSGSKRTGCCLKAPVVPIFAVVTPEERDWAVNAYKILTESDWNEKKRK
jgi:hypothetical protein